MRRFAIGVAALSLSLLLGAVDAARSETWNQLAVVAATVCGAWTVAGGVAHGDPADRFVRLHALAAGLAGVLVRTGKFREDALRDSGVEPTAVAESIADVPALLRRLG